VATLEQVVGRIRDGAVVGIGGTGLSRKPMAAVRALAASRVRDLEVVTFVGSLDVELLVRSGAVRAVRSSSVTLAPVGAASAFTGAVERGEICDIEESEWVLLGGLRAAAAGIPFIPTRAALGSELLRARGLRQVTDPYTGVSALAIPPLRPNVALIHAWRADPAGNVQAPWPPGHLSDVDLLLARAAEHVIVTTDSLVSEAEVKASAARTLLFGFEVDAIVETERGAFPTAAPPDYAADPSQIASEAAATLYPAAAEGPSRRRKNEARSR